MNARKLLSAAKAVEAAYIEDVFSTYLYTGNGSTQTITNGIDLSGKGGLVWGKCRSHAVASALIDTTRGASKYLISSSTSGELTNAALLTGFNSDGFTLGSDNNLNESTRTYASWTFREAPKFFDVVTYTGNGSARTIAHNLGSVPGCIIVKSTSQLDNWKVYHRSLTSNAYYILLDSTAAQSNAVDLWNSTTPTATEFSISSSGNINTNGATYVAYLFAHDAGGFGASGADNVISCGSFLADNYSNGPEINLGWEPQWLLVKNATNGAVGWITIDNMRGFTTSGADSTLAPNTSAAEVAQTGYYKILPTGFVGGTAGSGGSTHTFIYIAIRRGPMKTPTTGTSVFVPIARSGNSTATTVTGVGFAPDLVFEAPRTNSGGNNWIWFDRLRGGAQILSSDNSGAEVTNSTVIQSDSLSTTMDGFRIQTANPINSTGNTYIYYPLRRAPGFFDEVCYTGNGTNNRSIPHNLTIAPEIAIFKTRSQASDWDVYVASVWESINRNYLRLNTTGGAGNSNGDLFPSAFTATNLFVNSSSEVNGSGATYVAYLFATVAGVSKVGSYTGTGTTKQIDCGFTGGARFVLIKRTDSTGDWYVWDSARGIVAGNDPYLLLNSTAAEVTSTDYVDTYSAGFEISSTAPAAINANGGSFIFLAIA